MGSEKQNILFRDVKNLILKTIAIITLLIDKYFRIRTCIIAGKNKFPGSLYSDGVPYEPIYYWLIYKYSKKLLPSKNDIFYDIGCGMGRTICVFARMNLKKCVGIEISPGLVDLAKENVNKLAGRNTPVDFVVGDAALCDYRDGTIYWLFNPFGLETMTQVINKIEKSLYNNPRTIKIAYIHPVHEQVLNGRKLLRFIGRDSVWYSKISVSYWGSA